MVNPTVVTALAATVGSLVGAAASIATTWISQQTENIRANRQWSLRERDTLYKEFVTEASRLTLDALTHSLEQPEQMVKLYGILSCIRLMSGEEVVRQGEACCRRLVELYDRPNLTPDQLRVIVAANQVDELDPLKEFSTACRKELMGV